MGRERASSGYPVAAVNAGPMWSTITGSIVPGSATRTADRCCAWASFSGSNPRTSQDASDSQNCFIYASPSFSNVSISRQNPALDVLCRQRCRHRLATAIPANKRTKSAPPNLNSINTSRRTRSIIPRRSPGPPSVYRRLGCCDLAKPATAQGRDKPPALCRASTVG
jgi:hypothetical protein